MLIKNAHVFIDGEFRDVDVKYDNEKILNRECCRAKLSLDNAKNLASEMPIIFMTHYPPDERIINCVKGYNVKKYAPVPRQSSRIVCPDLWAGQ